MSSPEELQGALTCMAGMPVCADVHARNSKLERHMLWICCDRPNAKSLPGEEDIGGACTLPALCASLGFSAPVVSFV
jgi:hypothetical protein